MNSEPPARNTVCRFCGLRTAPYEHASVSECVIALEGEVAFFRRNVRPRNHTGVNTTRTRTGTFRDRRIA